MPSKRRRFYPARKTKKSQLENEGDPNNKKQQSHPLKHSDHFEIERIDEHRIVQE